MLEGIFNESFINDAESKRIVIFTVRVVLCKESSAGPNKWKTFQKLNCTLYGNNNTLSS